MKGAKKTNPNKVNQYTAPDPRQTLFIENYFTQGSPTFSNARQSAIAAGYSEQYADNLTATMPQWLSDFVGELDMLKRAERNISEMLELSPLVQAMGAFGPIYERKKETYIKKLKNGKKVKRTRTIQGRPVMVINAKLLKIKQDSSHFIAERLGKLKYMKSSPTPKLPPADPPAKLDFDDDRKKFS